MGSELRAAYTPIRAVPTIINATATTTPVELPAPASPNPSGVRRVEITHCGTTGFIGLVWATRADPSGTKITGQTIANASKIPAGGTRFYNLEYGMTAGYVGSASLDVSITISEAT